jgi:hypothetical protein
MQPEGRVVDEVEVVIGIDAHKRTHTLVACDRVGRELATNGPGDQ